MKIDRINAANRTGKLGRYPAPCITHTHTSQETHTMDTNSTTRMTYGGEGVELGLMTLERARDVYGSAKLDRSTGTITADDRACVVTYASGGRQVEFATYAGAVESLSQCEVIGHSGDLADGGGRTLAWPTEADSLDDDGARAHASITRAG